MPERLQISVDAASPVLQIPVEGLGAAVVTLGDLRVRTTQPCAYDSIDLDLFLNNTTLRAVSMKQERFEMMEPIPVHLTVSYRSTAEVNSCEVNLDIQEARMSVSPLSMRILYMAPFAAAAIMRPNAPVVPNIVQPKVPELLASEGQRPLDLGTAMTAATATERAAMLAQAVFGENGTAAVDAAKQGVEAAQAKQFKFHLVAQLEALEVRLSNNILPVFQIRLEMLPPGLSLYQHTLPPQLNLAIPECSAQMMAYADGAWEPLVERVCFGVSLDQGASDGVDKTRVCVDGHGPLQLNATPSMVQVMSRFGSLFFSSLSTVFGTGDTEVGGARYRVVNLCSESIVLTFLSPQTNFVEEMIVEPTGPKWQSLDDVVLPNFVTEVSAKLLGRPPSDALRLLGTGSVLIPESGFIAELMNDSTSYRVLLLSTPVRLHNDTELPVNVRLHRKNGEVFQINACNTMFCQAAVLGYDEPSNSVTRHGGYDVTDSRLSGLDLPPHSVFSVPSEALVCAHGATIPSRVIVSIQPSVGAAFCDKREVGKGVEPCILVCSHGEGRVCFHCRSEVKECRVPRPMAVTTVRLRPTLVFLNALPIGKLHVKYTAAASRSLWGLRFDSSSYALVLVLFVLLDLLVVLCCSSLFLLFLLLIFFLLVYWSLSLLEDTRTEDLFVCGEPQVAVLSDRAATYLHHAKHFLRPYAIRTHNSNAASCEHSLARRRLLGCHLFPEASLWRESQPLRNQQWRLRHNWAPCD